MTIKSRSFYLLAAAQLVCTHLLVGATPASGSAKLDPRVKPGARFIEEFQELGPTQTGPLTMSEIYIPKDYSTDRQFPLLVYFRESNGHHTVIEAKHITQRKRFVCAALPYKLILDQDGKPAEMAHNIPWTDYFKVMLDRIEEIVPNIDPEKRVCVGFSRGGKVITWEIGHTSGAFTDYFSFFICGSAWHRNDGWGDLAAINGHEVLLHYGELEYNRGISQVDELKGMYELAGAKLTFELIPGLGHKTPRAYYPRMLSWLEEKVLYPNLEEESAAMDKAMAAQAWGQASKHVTYVLGHSDPSRPEFAKAMEAQQVLIPICSKEFSSLRDRKAPIGDMKGFLKRWHAWPSPHVRQAEEACREVAEKELQAILKGNSFTRARRLEAFIESWSGHAICSQALSAYDIEAKKELTKIQSIRSDKTRSQKLVSFQSNWSQAACAAAAKELLESMAKEALIVAKRIKMGKRRIIALKKVSKGYPGTRSAKEALRLCGE